ncbi:MAG: hypothetical protein FWE64_03300 [Alphaproteobacteria bacterium]|nr:hypothetical protein [Alphaproteobacteria bacterium]
MKKLLRAFSLCLVTCALCLDSASAYQLVSSRELGTGEARNQNVTVRCTTPTGGTTNETCQLRRYVRCRRGGDGRTTCSGWQPWRDIRNPSREFGDWRSAADACCRAKGLR